jgi:subtilisin family serine protease
LAKTEELLLDNVPQRDAENTVQQLLASNLICLERIIAVLQEGDAIRPPPLVIAACGNASTASTKVHAYLPAAVHGVLSVAAAQRCPDGLTIASFSNVGARVCAPGVAVWSAAAGSACTGAHLLAVLSGTSMAAPHVTGVAVLWWEQARKQEVPEDEVAQFVAEKLGAFATHEGFVSGVNHFGIGRGIVQAPAAK